VSTYWTSGKEDRVRLVSRDVNSWAVLSRSSSRSRRRRRRHVVVVVVVVVVCGVVESEVVW